jgi:DNA-binding SARP family transcriptional activator
MSTLHIQLFDHFQLLYNGEPLPALNQGRLHSLLAYLVLHRDAAQTRRQLAFLFWPDSTEAQAHANLRQLLHRLQRALPTAGDFLLLDVKTVQWRPESPFTLDVAEFERQLTCAAEAARQGDATAVRSALQTAVAQYRGDLLLDCYYDWVLPERERWRETYLKTLERLISLLETQRDYAVAIAYAQRLLRSDPLHETTYGRLMRLHALAGDRASALRVYHTCATTLQRELGVEPSAQTRTVYAQLLNLDGSPVLPSSYDTHDEQLIGRQAEWQTLLTTWRLAAKGHAHLLVVAGEAGIGKTRLAEELLIWASRQGIRTARTRAYAAEGALAYAPVAEWLRTEGLRAGWRALDPVWLTELARILPELLVEQPHVPPPAPMTESWQRKRLFEALARAFLADDRPLLLVLDDLQWCDHETLAWLHYLLRYDPQARLLIAGTMRPEEVSSEHPLAALLLDLGSAGQVTELELGPLNLDGTAALAAQVTGQTLAPDVGQRLYQETEGNPLFVVETVRTEPSTGDAESAPLLPAFPTRLPPKVQAVIQRRLAQLSPRGAKACQSGRRDWPLVYLPGVGASERSGRRYTRARARRALAAADCTRAGHRYV